MRSFIFGSFQTASAGIGLTGFWQLVMLALALEGWYLLTGAHATVSGLIFPFAAIFTAWSMGHWFVEAYRLSDDVPGLSGVVPKVALGAPLATVSAFAFSLISPLSLQTDCALLASATVFLGGRRARSSCAPKNPDVGAVTETLFIALSLLLVSLWCRDLLAPVHQSGNLMVLRAWGDVFYHLSQISAWANAADWQTLSDVQMAGSSAQPYHMAAYLLPAALQSATGQGTWSAYAGFMLPFGLLLTSFAGYTLTMPWFGRPAATVAGLGLLLLPDAAQMGMGSPFLGYHWLQQVGPAGMYGTASAGLALCLMMLACKHRRWALVPWSYAFMLCTLLFKAQIFVAIAYPLLVFPALYLRGLRLPVRVLALLALTGIFVIVVGAGQLSPSVPLMRLDGSSLWQYSQTILDMQSGGWMKSLSAWAYAQAGTLWTGRAAVFSIVLLLSTFGLYAPAYFGLAVNARRSYPAMVWSSPLLILGGYLVMAVGMAFDDRRIGMPEELLHRPFVWAYFVVLTFVLGMLYAELHGEMWPMVRWQRFSWIGMSVLLLAVPVYFGKGIQTMPSWNQGDQRVPACLYRAAEYVRQRSQVHEIVQARGKDTNFMFAGLVERRPYALDGGGHRTPAGLQARLTEMLAVDTASSYAEVSAFFTARHVSWYVLHDASTPPWTRDPLATPAFACDDVRVFKFSP